MVHPIDKNLQKSGEGGTAPIDSPKAFYYYFPGLIFKCISLKHRSLFCAVLGGVFGEGIDLVGDRLTGAVIVGVGLPGISLERELIKDYFDRCQDSGFEYAYMYPGMNRVCQAAGRVIRSDRDRGVVLLIDHRFSTPPYRELFPYHWVPIRLRDEEHLAKVLENFWETASSP